MVAAEPFSQWKPSLQAWFLAGNIPGVACCVCGCWAILKCMYGFALRDSGVNYAIGVLGVYVKRVMESFRNDWRGFGLVSNVRCFDRYRVLLWDSAC